MQVSITLHDDAQIETVVADVKMTAADENIAVLTVTMPHGAEWEYRVTPREWTSLLNGDSVCVGSVGDVLRIVA